MSNKIKIKRKTTPGAPSSSALDTGEMCLVVPDKKVYIKNDDDTVTLLNNLITSGTAAPSGGNDGDIYLQYTE